MLPAFTDDGCLPPGDYELAFDEPRSSLLVGGPENGYPNWDRAWRAQLLDHLEVLVRQLWQVGATEIFRGWLVRGGQGAPERLYPHFGRLSEIATGTAASSSSRPRFGSRVAMDGCEGS